MLLSTIHKGDQSFSQPHRSLNCDVADGVENEQRHVNQVVRRGHHRSLSNTNNLLKTLEDNTNTIETEITTANTLGFMERPVKLPLRKYHSFHFQPTQTVAGQQMCKLQQLRLQQQQNSLESQDSSPEITATQPYAKQGPLVFRPYKIDESVTFKPIQPSEESEDSIDYVREYVGTVEKFLKDEEKYMDSGDFTNLTQRLKQQQDFLNANNSPHSSGREDSRVMSHRELKESTLTDSEPNSLYEDLTFQSQAQQGSANRSNTLKEPVEKSQHFINSPRAVNLLKSVIETDSPEHLKVSLSDIPEKAQQFMHSPRALNLLKTVIETDDFQSDEEQEDDAMSRRCEQSFSNKEYKVSCVKRLNQQFENSSGSPLNKCIRKNSLKSPSSPKLSCISSYSVDSVDSGINSQVYRDISSSCARNDSVKSTSSSKVSTLCRTKQNSLENEESKNLNSRSCARNDSVKSTSSLKVSTLSRTKLNSLDNEECKDMNRTAIQNTPSSPKVSTLAEFTLDSENNTVLNANSNRGIPEDFCKSTNSPKVSTLEKFSRNSDYYSSTIKENKNPQNVNTQPTSSTKIFNLSKFSKNMPEDFHNTSKSSQETPINSTKHSTLCRKNPSKEKFQGINIDKQTNSPKRTNSYLCKKSLQFSLDNSKLKENTEQTLDPLNSTANVLTEKDLANVFKPYKQQETIRHVKETEALSQLDSLRPISTALNPAASLEALEMLTKSNPELWTSNQAGSRHNLHQLELFHSLHQQTENQNSNKSQQPQDDEEDLGYSFCEDENDDEEEEEENQKPPPSPNVTVIMAANSQTASQVKYVLTQNHREVHI
ncbi:protein lingerer-like [Calliphora vicina]|uniref:protein lingerer-like n=1 Tax=Calliphora vicina TaxID=7373 RepID=UPI00325AD424